jgi:hypothetical protein
MWALVSIVTGLALWFACFGYALRATRGEPVIAGPPVQVLPGAEPPAVVCLLTRGWPSTTHAAESTLIDLAARRILEFRQPGDDPSKTTIHIREPEPVGLNAYEQRVFDWVAPLAGPADPSGTPVSTLAFTDLRFARTWHRHFAAEVAADTRTRGLTASRFSGTTKAGLAVAAVFPSMGVALPHMPVLTFWVWMFFAVATLYIEVGERRTPAGQEAAARWLGLARYLEQHEQFADLPPASVAVWDRYLPYGHALGVTRVCAEVIDMGVPARNAGRSHAPPEWLPRKDYERGSNRNRNLAEPANNYETLVRSAMGRRGRVECKPHIPLARLAPTGLLSQAEVSQALHIPLRDARRLERVVMVVETFYGLDGKALLVAMVSSGETGERLIAHDRRNERIEGLADEAYASDRRIVGRIGDRVVRLELFGVPRQFGSPYAVKLPWLLGKAFHRLADLDRGTAGAADSEQVG